MVFFEKFFFNKGAYLLLIFLENVLLYRFYFSQNPNNYSLSDLYLQFLIIAITNPILFICLWRASNWDCGKVPKGQSTALYNSSVQICHKCSAVRINEFVHHCSRCDACIDMMDHHCTFLGQCVGKNNMKYFTQFCMYLVLMILYAMLKMLSLCYTQNARLNVGVQGITWLYFPWPTLYLRIFYYTIEEGGYDWLRTLDNLMLLVMLFFGLFALLMLGAFLLNLY